MKSPGLKDQPRKNVKTREITIRDKQVHNKRNQRTGIKKIKKLT